MAAEKDKAGRYVWGGIAVLCLLILLGWLAFRQSSPPPEQLPAKVESPKPQARSEAPVFETADDSTQKAMVGQTNASVTTNAADLYRQAFALYDALTNDEKNILSDWRTNVDASVESELCQKIRPICDLMHQAAAVANCDWGVGPIVLDTKLPHIKQTRDISRAALWNAAHCRSNDVSGATDDVVAVLRLDQKVSSSTVLACLMDMALQNMAAAYVAQNIGLFGGTDNQRLAAAFSDPSHEEAPSGAMKEEADTVDRLAVKLASFAPDEAEKELSKLPSSFEIDAPAVDRDAALATLKQVSDLDRELAKALLSSSEDTYETWLRHWNGLQAASPFSKQFVATDDLFVAKVRAAEVNRALVVAGLAVAENGPDALAAHPDPSSGQPFVYTETADGFVLQSSHQLNGKPMTMQFK